MNVGDLWSFDIRAIMDLAIEIVPGLIIKDPFMISSSHWTATENSLAKISSFSPSALTLKTTSSKKGGSGQADIGRRTMHRLEDSRGNHFATYTDGPATLELLDIAQTHILTCQAKKVLPDTKIGLSVLQGEEYEKICKSLQMENYSYVELNLKYSFRKIQLISFKDAVDNIAKDIHAFLSVFNRLPVLIKFPREATGLFPLADFGELFSNIAKAKAGVIIANSLKVLVPPSRSPLKTLSELTNGVIVGEHLFLDTYDTIRNLTLNKKNGGTIPPIIASGGIIDIGGVIDIIAAGAEAVQLCTALDIVGPFALPLLREQLKVLCKEHGSYNNFLKNLRANKALWKKSAITSRDMRISEESLVHDIFKDEGYIINCLSNSILEECKFCDKPKENDNHEVQIPENLQFVVNKGNIGAFFLATQIVEKHHLTPLNFESAGDFSKQLSKSNTSWDFAILPNSTVALMNREKEHIAKDLRSVTIDSIGNSIIHLMGVKSLELAQVEGVYHFTGNSARFGLSQLLAECHLKTDDLIGPQLLALLRCWNSKRAILAKPPLAFLYGLLCREEIKKEWSIIWSVSEPLCLVASQALLARPNGQEIAKTIVKKINKERGLLLENPTLAAKRVRGEGYLGYCELMLMGT